jgi:hypothetical protein
MVDTLDLQDKSSPTAQDHSSQPEHPAPLGIGPAAPHQQASLRHVEEERDAEEAKLQNAWSNAGNDLRDDPGSDDERTVINANAQKNSQQDEQAIRLNGGVSGDGDDSDMQDADVEEDMDDDMMDKISSSPSIDDGGYFLPLPSAIWPQRTQSLTPESSPMQPTIASSSPFTTTPIHFPISVAGARGPFDVPAQGDSPVTRLSYSSTSIPISLRFSQQNESKSTEHHRGEYAWTRTTPELDEDDSNSELDYAISPRSKQRKSIERRLKMKITREDSDMSLVSDLDEAEATNMLRPMRLPTTLSKSMDASDDPFLGPTASPPRTTNGTPPPKIGHPVDDDDSWTTDSNADSWDEDLDKDDDASNDVSFSDNPRFIDSGWGGECLRETEDIDFEFVYALHTFVATVEGQANATKGDTMVLLDDSNSYWWLVRVVKDSSIGEYSYPTRRVLLIKSRLPTRRTHRDANRTIGQIEQAQKHRPLSNNAWGYCGEDEEPTQEGHATTKCENCSICTAHICRSLGLRLLIRRRWRRIVWWT